MTLVRGAPVTKAARQARLAALLEPVIEQLGYRLVRIRVSAMNGTTPASAASA